MRAGISWKIMHSCNPCCCLVLKSFVSWKRQLLKLYNNANNYIVRKITSVLGLHTRSAQPMYSPERSLNHQAVFKAQSMCACGER